MTVARSLNKRATISYRENQGSLAADPPLRGGVGTGMGYGICGLEWPGGETHKKIGDCRQGAVS